MVVKIVKSEAYTLSLPIVFFVPAFPDIKKKREAEEERTRARLRETNSYLRCELVIHL